MAERCFTVVSGDVLAQLRSAPSEYFDALLSDVPYGLGTKQPSMPEIVAYLVGGEMETGGDFMGNKWHVPSVNVWREVMRVLKPGAPLLVNAAPRTEDLVALGLRAAGFEIRDIVMWMFAESMPKGHAIGKALDRAAGAKREVLGEGAARCVYLARGEKCPGHGDANGKYGETVHAAATAPVTDLAKAWDGYGTDLAPGYEPVILARKPIVGTYVQNVIAHGTGGLNIDGCRIPRAADYGAIAGARGDSFNARGGWPKNVIMDAAAGAELDAEVGERASGIAVTRNGGGGFIFAGQKGHGPRPDTGYTDTGGPSRFYKYCAKASTAERHMGVAEGANGHPNVKPIDLTRYLAKLVLPPTREGEPRRLLVPYCGSGSEMVGAILAGWDEVVGIEREAEYVTTARARVALAETNPRAFEALIEGDLERGDKVDERQIGLFGGDNGGS